MSASAHELSRRARVIGSEREWRELPVKRRRVIELYLSGVGPVPSGYEQLDKAMK